MKKIILIVTVFMVYWMRDSHGWSNPLEAKFKTYESAYAFASDLEKDKGNTNIIIDEVRL